MPPARNPHEGKPDRIGVIFFFWLPAVLFLASLLALLAWLAVAIA